MCILENFCGKVFIYFRYLLKFFFFFSVYGIFEDIVVFFVGWGCVDGIVWVFVDYVWFLFRGIFIGIIGFFGDFIYGGFFLIFDLFVMYLLLLFFVVVFGVVIRS